MKVWERKNDASIINAIGECGNIHLFKNLINLSPL